MSSNGPAEACTSGINPAAWEWVSTNEPGGRSYHDLNDGDAKMLIDHRMQPDGSLAKEPDELGVRHVDREFDIVLSQRQHLLRARASYLQSKLHAKVPQSLDTRLVALVPNAPRQDQFPLVLAYRMLRMCRKEELECLELRLVLLLWSGEHSSAMRARCREVDVPELSD